MAEGFRSLFAFWLGGGANNTTAITGQIKVYLAGSWQAKPVKVWDGVAFVVKPLKVWNGSTWVTTTY